MRPNGGILARGFEGHDHPDHRHHVLRADPEQLPDETPCSIPAIDLVYPTVDVAQQYDFLGGDAPARLDLLAFANSIAAYALLHGNMPNRSIEPGGEVPTTDSVDLPGHVRRHHVLHGHRAAASAC